MPVNVLVVDDESSFCELIAEVLGEEGHNVLIAGTLTEARRWLAKRDFHLVVVDIELPDGEDGLDLLPDIAEVNRQPGRACAPIVLTGKPTQDRAIRAINQGAFRFLLKNARPEESIVLKSGKGSCGFAEEELRDAARKALRRVLSEQSARCADTIHTLRFDLSLAERTRADLSGPTAAFTESVRPLTLDIDAFARKVDDLQFHFAASNEEERPRWRSRAKDIGRDLHEKLFGSDAALSSALSTARERCGSHPLHLVFRGAPDMLRLPFELLPGEAGSLVIENPLIRQISGVNTTRRRGIDRAFLEETPEIKILLIGSDTEPAIPGVDEEIDQLHRVLPRLLKARGFPCTVDALATSEADWDSVYACLDRCQYHIVHYAGHGFHDEKHSDESGIAFWEKPNRGGQVRRMPIRILKNLLIRSDTRFFYLSCCVGAKTVAEASSRLNGNDFQGILEGLMRVGIPAALGHRWNVWDVEAKELSLAFYENLFTDLRLDLAIFKARRALEEAKCDNETWASPVLVTQST